MIAINKRVVIIPSDDLAEMHLSGTVGRKGKIAEQIFGGTGELLGYMVCLDKSFQSECLWFIPENAVSHEEDNN